MSDEESNNLTIAYMSGFDDAKKKMRPEINRLKSKAHKLIKSLDDADKTESRLCDDIADLYVIINEKDALLLEAYKLINNRIDADYLDEKEAISLDRIVEGIE